MSNRTDEEHKARAKVLARLTCDILVPLSPSPSTGGCSAGGSLPLATLTLLG